MTAYSPVYTSVNYVYAKTGLSSTECDLSTDENSKLIEDAELEVESETGRKYTNSNSKTEYFDGQPKDIIGISGTKTTAVSLSNYPILSITEFKTLNVDGSANTTYDNLTSVQIAAGTFETDDYWLETTEDYVTHTNIAYGRIALKTDEFPTGIRNIKVAYTYGYATVPIAIRDLATCLAGIRVWIHFLGGSYNYLNSYSIPQQSVSKGDFYQRGSQMIQTLTDEANRLLDRIGRRQRTLFVAGASK